MVSTAHPSTPPGEPTIEQLAADAQAGTFDDRLDVTVPPELFGPPTVAERTAARGTNGRTVGADANRPIPKKRLPRPGTAARQGLVTIAKPYGTGC